MESQNIWQTLITNHDAVRSFGLVIAAIIALPLAIWRSRIAAKQAKTAQGQFEITAENHLADTYTKAIDQIGHKEIAIKLGGLYALKKLAFANKGYHGQIMEVLCAFVRLHALPHKYEEEEGPKYNDEYLRSNAIIVQTALTIIGKRNIEFDTKEMNLDLSSTNLQRADLERANLRGANLQGTNLRRANIQRANLERADLRGAKLQEASLVGANLYNTTFYEADLHKAILIQANLERADLRNTNLEEAILLLANLRGANLGGANLKETVLVQAKNLREAKDLTVNQIGSAEIDEATLLSEGMGDQHVPKPLSQKAKDLVNKGP